MDETFEYDGNGNITKSFRHGDFYAAPKDMDDLTYNYNRDANGHLLNNKLDHINDAIPFVSAFVGVVTNKPKFYSRERIPNSSWPFA